MVLSGGKLSDMMVLYIFLISAMSVLLPKMTSRGRGSNLVYRLLSDESRRSCNHCDDEHLERECVLVHAGNVTGAEILEQAQDDPSQHGAGDAPDASQDRGRERLEAGEISHEEMDDPIIQGHHDACHSGQ